MQKGTTVRKKRLHTGIRLLAVLMVLALLCLDREAVSGSAKLDLRQALESRYGTEYSREIGITEAGAQLMEQMTISITPAHKIGPRRWLRNYTETPVRYLCSVRYDRQMQPACLRSIHRSHSAEASAENAAAQAMQACNGFSEKNILFRKWNRMFFLCEKACRWQSVQLFWKSTVALPSAS